MACLLVLALLSFLEAGECGTSPYGKPAKYSLNMVISYPDFTIRFIGTRREVSKVYPRGFLYYDFEIISNKGSKTKVSWSSGTGVLGPVEFSVEGGRYYLELKANSLERDPEMSWLKENEMIIWRKEVYIEIQRELDGKRK
ncbi:MAG: hypothetical protein ABFD97_19620 [Syntrophobacter sp.]